MLVREALAESGPRFALHHVRHLSAAAERVEAGGIDLVLLDLSLPDSFGPSTFLTLSVLCPDVPIVVMTGFDDEDLGARLVQLGAQDFLGKSELGARTLSRAIRHALERARIENELRLARLAALEAVQAKSEFLAAMSHEIRTPMNSILGMADLLGETALTTDQERYVDVFRRAGEGLLHLINSILDLSRAESGRLEIEPECFDLPELLETTVELLALQAHQKGLSISADWSADAPRHVIADEGRLRQVIVNLLGNAIKFTERGEVSVQLGLASEAGVCPMLRFAVQDTGIGIAPEKLELIFQRFSQADGSVTRRYGGTGLGLSLCLELVTAMGGRIDVESREGEGSVFEFVIPLVTPESPVDAGGAGSAGRPAPERVLVAAPPGSERSALLARLRALGVEPHVVGDGERALATIVEQARSDRAFDLIILSSRLSGMSGFEVLEELRDERGVLQRTVLVLPTNHRPQDFSLCRRYGLAGWLIAPVRVCALESMLVRERPAQQAPASHVAATAMGLSSMGAQTGSGTTTGEPSDSQSAEGSGLRILLTDDSEDNRALVLCYMKGTPHRVEVAENGAVALDKFRSKRFDVVLMDMQMPVMDGYTATRRIRDFEADRPRTPVLALTAHALPEERARSFEAGCDAHLTKPIRKQALLDAIESYTRADRLVVKVDEDVRELMSTFVENRERDAQRIAEALEQGDFEVVRVLGHNMKGAGASYGVPCVSEAGGLLEAAARREARPEAEKALAQLQSDLERLEWE